MEQSDANEMTPSLPKQDVEGGPVSILKKKRNELTLRIVFLMLLDIVGEGVFSVSLVQKL